MTDPKKPSAPTRPVKNTPVKQAPAKPAAKVAKPAADEAKTSSAAPRKKTAANAPAAGPSLRVVGGTDVPAPSAPPPPPDGMGPRGRTLWRKVLAIYDFRPDELVVFESACRAEDRVKDLSDELSKMETMIPG